MENLGNYETPEVSENKSNVIDFSDEIDVITRKIESTCNSTSWH